MNRYEIIRAESGPQLPAIVDNETGESILSIDTRPVGETNYSTPVFTDPDIAERVLELLNTP